ncbi:MAG: adenylate/guanylate cyclase domain-containing protein [Rectinemataceae bacterium]
MREITIASLTLTPRRRKIFLSIGIIGLVSALASAVFGVVGTMLLGAQPTPRVAVESAIIGAVVATCAASAEYFLFMRSFGRLPFIAIFCLRLLLWGGLSLAGTWAIRADSRFYGTGVVFAVLLGTVFTITVYLLRLVGGRTQLRFVSGRYNHPREQERVFLFADIKGSTSIAERIGNRLYHEFLNDVWFDISDAVAACRGEIYKYVGDEIIVTWTVRSAVADIRCLRLCAAIPRILARRRSYYDKRYRAVSELKQGLHAGFVTVGEMGDARMEIAYLGDVLNTTSRLTSYADVMKVPALISGELVRLLPEWTEGLLRNLGSVTLRGKEHSIDVYTLASEMPSRSISSAGQTAYQTEHGLRGAYSK